jgi:hypothetical protein
MIFNARAQGGRKKVITQYGFIKIRITGKAPVGVK